MNNKMRCRFFWVIGLLLPAAVLGQPCSQLLSLMEDQYEAGALLPIPQRITDCIRGAGDRFTKAERIRAHRLAVLSHLFTDNQEASEGSMEALLRLSPEYVFSEDADPKELFYLYEKFRAEPIYRFAFYLMGNYSIVNSSRSYGVENTATASEQASGGVLGGAGVAVEKHLFSFFDLVVGAQFSSRSFSLRNDLYDYSYYELNEVQFWFDAPIGARFFPLPSSKKRFFQPYFQVGWMPSLLFSSSLSGIRQGGGVVNLGSLSLLDEGKRKLFAHSAFLGLGFKYRLRNRRNFLIVDLAYVRNNTNLVRQDRRYLGNQDFHFRLGYVDDNFSVDALQASVGFLFSVYNPKKLRRYRDK